MQCNVSRYVCRHAHVTTYIYRFASVQSVYIFIGFLLVCKENNRNLSVVHSPAFSKKATNNDQKEHPMSIVWPTLSHNLEHKNTDHQQAHTHTHPPNILWNLHCVFHASTLPWPVVCCWLSRTNWEHINRDSLCQWCFCFGWTGALYFRQPSTMQSG